jgi:hypothetical protein
MGVSRKQIEQWKEQGAIFTDEDFEGLRTLTTESPHLYNWEDENVGIPEQDQ